MHLPDDVVIYNLQAIKGEVTGEADVLIGMDVISFGDLAITNYKKQTKFTFRIPSQGSLDFVKEINKLQKTQRPKIGRNDPCYCGSGKKYKYCHGKS